MKTKKKMKSTVNINFSTLLSALAVCLMSVSCADEDLSKGQDNNGENGVSFSVTDVQDAPDADMLTHAADAKTYLVHSINFNEAGTSDMCLQESTVPGVNPMKRTPKTRAWLKSTIDANFGALACKNGSADPDFFYNEEVNRHGQMVHPKSWESSASTLKFYAVYPYMDGTNTRQKLVQAVAGSMPYVAFEASTDIANQTDLMTAETAPVSYTATGGAPHVVPLKFYHALTAIRFGIGSNLSWNKTIKSIEFRGIHNTGRFNLAAKTWSNQSGMQNFKLDNINKPTAGTLNTVIVKDGNTFLMVPQTLPAGAKIVITFADATQITANIGGKTWTAGTTKTYMITEKNSNWEYKIEVTDPAVIAYDQTQSTTPYTIKSYRKDPATNTFQPVKWKVVGYQESTDGGATWGPETTTKPAWLTNLSLTEGDGGTAAESGAPTVTTEIIDYLAPYNKVLQDATPRGSAGNPYDLSMHDFKGNARATRSTANSYLISAPGWYKIPLVYGNAITNGATNTSSYKTSNSGTYILTNFKDHNNQDITDPWITQSHGGANAPDGAKIVWTDQSGLVTHISVSGSGTNAFVNFEVPAANIKNGNAVIAVTKGGTVVWSWHLWFDHDDVLETIPCTNFQGYVYKFTKMPLGFAYRKWESSTYDKPRVARLKVEQETRNGGVKQVAYIAITQKPGNVKEIMSTLYQWGRKDALPGTEAISDGSFNKNGGNNMSISNGIQHPENCYGYGTSWYSDPPTGCSYYNLWSADNTTTGYNDAPVIKTVYDPCPAGFHLPASHAFNGFNRTGDGSDNKADFNISGTWDNGWTFNNKLTNPDATIYFPALGERFDFGGSLYFAGINGCYWSALPYSTANGCNLLFSQEAVYTQAGYTRPCGFSVRPVAE